MSNRRASHSSSKSGRSPSARRTKLPRVGYKLTLDASGGRPIAGVPSTNTLHRILRPTPENTNSERAVARTETDAVPSKKRQNDIDESLPDGSPSKKRAYGASSSGHSLDRTAQWRPPYDKGYATIVCPKCKELYALDEDVHMCIHNY